MQSLTTNYLTVASVTVPAGHYIVSADYPVQGNYGDTVYCLLNGTGIAVSDEGVANIGGVIGIGAGSLQSSLNAPSTETVSLECEAQGTVTGDKMRSPLDLVAMPVDGVRGTG